MTVKELFSEWSKPEELRRGMRLSALAVVFFMAFGKHNIWMWIGIVMLLVLFAICSIRLFIITHKQ